MTLENRRDPRLRRRTAPRPSTKVSGGGSTPTSEDPRLPDRAVQPSGGRGARSRFGSGLTKAAPGFRPQPASSGGPTSRLRTTGLPRPRCRRRGSFHELERRVQPLPTASVPRQGSRPERKTYASFAEFPADPDGKRLAVAGRSLARLPGRRRTRPAPRSTSAGELARALERAEAAPRRAPRSATGETATRSGRRGTPRFMLAEQTGGRAARVSDYDGEQGLTVRLRGLWRFKLITELRRPSAGDSGSLRARSTRHGTGRAPGFQTALPVVGFFRGGRRGIAGEIFGGALKGTYSSSTTAVSRFVQFDHARAEGGRGAER